MKIIVKRKTFDKSSDPKRLKDTDLNKQLPSPIKERVHGDKASIRLDSKGQNLAALYVAIYQYSSNNLITYVPNTWYFRDKINEVISNRDCMDLCYDDYMFKRHRIIKTLKSLKDMQIPDRYKLNQQNEINLTLAPKYDMTDFDTAAI
ncbi:unnamed protein product [Brachionus calyciflorus]|uniref:Uncharacterized protein n=1 Tax=Brachionus calyciflorus TaxID=104777 RepID=A0A813N0V3_9BILA|nr:unnamed protein product [Brachionus calyciflorus]